MHPEEMTGAAAPSTTQSQQGSQMAWADGLHPPHAYLLPPSRPLAQCEVKGVMARNRNELRWLRMRDDDASSAGLTMTPKNRKSIPFGYFGLGV